jgi:anti-sigma regulatory factor (Ser/Thr protein kinase)
MEPLSVPGTLDSLSAVADYVKAAAATAGLDKRAAYRLRLAVDEIVTNIVTHGYAAAGLEGTVDLQAEVEEEALTILVEDTGVAFDPRQHATPDDLDLPLEQRHMGGLGVYLVIQNVDQFLYERVGDRNRNIFVMNRPEAPATATLVGQ